MIIMFFLNFTLLCCISRISSPRKFSFPVKIMMVSMSYPSLLSCQFLKFFWCPHLSVTANMWHRCLGQPTPCILNLLVSNNKIVYTSRRSLTQCQACPLGKSLRLTGHKTTAPLDLIFSDVWGLAPMFSFDGFHHFVIFIDAHTKHLWYYPLVCQIWCVFHFSSFSNTCRVLVFM